MTVHTGDRADKTADYACTDCEQTIHLEEGDEIPQCSCGCTEFEEWVPQQYGGAGGLYEE